MNPELAVDAIKEEPKLESFDQAFAPLCFHLFPDGCPLAGGSGISNTNYGGNFDEIWPQPKSRAIVAAKEALDSLRILGKIGKCSGFTSQQQDLIVVVAIATLPSSQSDDLGDGVVKSSPLIDGSSRTFRGILRFNLPKPGHPVSAFAVMKLLEALRNKQVDLMGSICVLQCLTLSARNGALSEEARQALSSVYSMLLSLATKADLCADAVRLLHAITRNSHVRVYRAERLHDFYQQCAQEQVNFASLWLLLQLYAHFDPQKCGNFFAGINRSDTNAKQKSQLECKRYALWFSFPDPVWERNFHRTWHRDTEKGDGCDQQHKNSPIRKRQKKTSSFDRLTANFVRDQSAPSLAGLSSKTSASASNLLSDTCLAHLMLLSSNASSSSSATEEVAHLKVCLPFMLQQEWYYNSASNASNKHGSSENPGDASSDNESDDETMNGRADVSGEHTTSNEKDERTYDKNSTTAEEPTHMGQESIDSSSSMTLPTVKTDRAAARLQIIEALASRVTQTAQIPPEAESILTEETLRSWDGTAEWGAALCYDILPCVSSSSSFVELKSKILSSLEKVFLYGTPKLQYAIVSGVLASLLGHLATQSRDTACTDDTIEQNRQQKTEESGQQKQEQQLRKQVLGKRKLIKAFIHWTDELLLRGLLSTPEGANELLLGAAIDFFRMVGQDVAEHCNVLILPSSSLVYRFLFSTSPVSIDRVCQLLLDYKRSFQSLKAKLEQASSNDAVNGSLKVEGLDRVAVFNCMVWDFCSVLWSNSLFQSSQGGKNQTSMSLLCADLSEGTLTKVSKHQKLASALSITHGAVFAQYASEFLDVKSRGQRAEEGKEPWSLDKLKEKVKEEYLDYLKTEGFMDGLHAFLTTFIGSLQARKGFVVASAQSSNVYKTPAKGGVRIGKAADWDDYYTPADMSAPVEKGNDAAQWDDYYTPADMNAAASDADDEKHKTPSKSKPDDDSMALLDDDAKHKPATDGSDDNDDDYYSNGIMKKYDKEDDNEEDDEKDDDNDDEYYSNSIMKKYDNEDDSEEDDDNDDDYYSNSIMKKYANEKSKPNNLKKGWSGADIFFLFLSISLVAAFFVFLAKKGLATRRRRAATELMGGVWLSQDGLVNGDDGGRYTDEPTPISPEGSALDSYLHSQNTLANGQATLPVSSRAPVPPQDFEFDEFSFDGGDKKAGAVEMR